MQLQCYFWIVFMSFATIGCSAKKTFFEAFSVHVETPLSGSKAISISSNTSCDVQLVSKEITNKKEVVQQAKQLFPLTMNGTTDLSSIPVKKIFKKGYLLKLAGNAPPLYILLKQFKFALL